MSDTNADGTTPVPPSGPPAPPAYDPAATYPPPAPSQPYGSAPPAYDPTAYATAPAYGAAPAYGSPYGAYAPAKTNTLAIVSLVCSLVGLFIIPFLGSLAGVITGHMALGQIKRSGEQGRGLALAGTITGYVGLAFVLLGVILFFALFLPLMIATANTSV